MPGNDNLIHSNHTQKVILSFQTLADIRNFKNECNCKDFYIDRDSLNLVGTFTDAQLQLATKMYNAICKMEKE